MEGGKVFESVRRFLKKRCGLDLNCQVGARKGRQSASGAGRFESMILNGPISEGSDRSRIISIQIL